MYLTLITPDPFVPCLPQDPCVIAGFDMDRLGTVTALAKEPAGTFICRFSLSQPGCLVLSTKVPPGCQSADHDNLLHAIINVRCPHFC